MPKVVLGPNKHNRTLKRIFCSASNVIRTFKGNREERERNKPLPVAHGTDEEFIKTLGNLSAEGRIQLKRTLKKHDVSVWTRFSCLKAVGRF